jgi:hypothetical protein
MRKVALSFVGALATAQPLFVWRTRCAVARLFAYGDPAEATCRSQQGYWFHPVTTDNSLQFWLGYLHLDLVFFERLPLCVPDPVGNG